LPFICSGQVSHRRIYLSGSLKTRKNLRGEGWNIKFIHADSMTLMLYRTENSILSTPQMVFMSGLTTSQLCTAISGTC
jgi:hypothetical protein